MGEAMFTKDAMVFAERVVVTIEKALFIYMPQP